MKRTHRNTISLLLACLISAACGTSRLPTPTIQPTPSPENTPTALPTPIPINASSMDDTVPMTAENAFLVESLADLWPAKMYISDLHFYPGTDLVALGTGESITEAVSYPTNTYMSVNYNPKVVLWDPRTNIGQDAFTSVKAGPDPSDPYSNEFDSLAISPDGSHIAFVGIDQIVLGTRIGTANDGSPTFSSQVLPAGKMGVIMPDEGAAFSADGRLLAVASCGDLQVWDVPSGQVLGAYTPDPNGRSCGGSYSPQGVAFTLDGRSVLSAGNGGLNITALDSYQRTGLPIPGAGAGVVAFSPDLQIVIAGGLTGAIIVLSYPAGEGQTELKVHNDTIRSLAFSHDGKLAVSASQDGTVVLWDTHTWEPLATLATPADLLAFSPDGRFLVTGSHTDGGKLWGVRSFDSLVARDGVKVALAEGGIPLASWNADIPPAWLAPAGTPPRYEILLASSWDIVGSCAYTLKGDTRFVSIKRSKVTVRIVDLKSGETVAQKAFLGEKPGGCMDTYTFSNDQPSGALYSGTPAPTEFLTWLNSVMAPLGYH